MGGVAVDYLAEVLKYPEPDQKLRSERLEVQGGGNCGNALTAASRLGTEPFIITMVGNDAMGDSIVDGLAKEGIRTEHVCHGEGPSPFTYIIVDRTGGTRTCIHTPGPPMAPGDLPPAAVTAALADAALIYFDGRLTETALVVAAAARAQGVPVLVEAERLRPHLEELLMLADYVVTSKHFPQDWTGEPLLSDALLVSLTRLPRARFLITTLGARGSVLLERCDASHGAVVESEEELASVLAALEAAATTNEVAVAPARSYVPTAAALVRRAAGGEGDAAAGAAAAKEATANADAGNAARYMSVGDAVHATVLFAAAQALTAPQLVDSTGAGDAFIGCVCHALCEGLPRARMLQLASYVAATNCKTLGARDGLPHRADVPAHLL